MSSNSRLHHLPSTSVQMANADESANGLKKLKLEQQDLKEENQNENYNRESEIMLNPLMMEDILDLVFLNLDMKSLKIARQVTKLWEELAMKRMLQIGLFFKIPPKFHKQSKEEKKDQVDKMQSLFLSSKIHKIKSVQLSQKKDVKVFKSLNILGSQVQELKLPFRDFVPKYGKIIKKDLVNLTHLTNSSNQWTYAFELDIILDLDKPLIISNLLILAFDQGSWDWLEQLSEGKVKLMRVEFHARGSIEKSPVTWSRVSKILTKILESSRDTLEEFRIFFPLDILPGFQLPVMPHLKKLLCQIVPFATLRLQNELHQGHFFPANFRFMEHFPNLTQVELLCVNTSLSPSTLYYVLAFDIWERIFENKGIANKVKTVYYRNPIGFSTDILNKIFPNAIITEKPYSGRRQ